MRLNHLDILEQCFRDKIFGYNKEDVDTFLHLVAEDFKEIIEDVNIRYNLKNLQFYIGGFSIGGSCVLKFAEDAVKDNYQYQADGIFLVDAPLDFVRFYNSYK